MTKTLSVLLFAIVIAFTACGPNQEQIALEKAKQDSIAKAAEKPKKGAKKAAKKVETKEAKSMKKARG